MFRLSAPFLLIAGIALAGLSGCGGKTQMSSASGSPSSNYSSTQPVTVRVFQVAPSVVRGDLMIPAALSIEGVALITAQRDGAIVQLGAQEGSRVSKGEVVARLSGDDDLRAQLRQAELEVKRLQVEQQQLEALAKLNSNEFEREKLLAKQGLTSQSEVEHAQFRFEAAKLELEKSRVASQSAQSKADAVKVELKKTTVSAPISGLVTHRYVEMGSSVAKNDKLFEISPLSPLQVRFQLPQADRATLGPGSLVGVSQVDGDKIVASARVRRIQPVADAASNTYGYVADVIGGQGLTPGLAVTVRVPRSQSSPNAMVPRSAFPDGSNLRRGTAATLFIVEGDRSAVRTVWVNTIDLDQVEVVSGLNAGDRVILSPPAQLKAGDLLLVKD